MNSPQGRQSSDSAVADARYRFSADLELKRPKRPEEWRPFGLGAVALVGLLLAAVVSPWHLKVIMLAAGGFFLIIAWGMHRLMTAVDYGVVRVTEGTAALTFVPPRVIAWMDNVVTGYLLAFWVTLLVLILAPGGATLTPSVTIVGAVLVLPGIVGYYVWQLMHPRGLTLTPEGIRGVRRGPKVDVQWGQLLEVFVDELPGRGKLVMMTWDRKVVSIDATRFGSDAQAVAHIIRHFRENERERPLLREGAQVLERFGARRIGSA